MARPIAPSFCGIASPARAPKPMPTTVLPITSGQIGIRLDELDWTNRLIRPIYHTPYPIQPRGVSIVTHTIIEKSKLLNRIRRMRGQIEAIERAIEDEKGCAAVLHLIVGARGAINGLMAEVIEDHIRLHVAQPAKDTERRRGAEELIEAVQSYLK
jgi:DNA-binding FrmR family transcriptional regulator